MTISRPATTSEFYRSQSRAKLQGALADAVVDGLVRGDGVEPFGLGLALVTQEVNQTQSLTLRSQLQSPRPSVPHQ